MMGAARAGFYKKRSSNPTLTSTPKKKKGTTSSSRTSSVASSPSLSSKNRLAVPNPPLRKRSGSAPSIKMITLASIWNLKHEHVRALKTTWARLCEPPRANCKGIVSLVERVWEKLDTKDKDVRNIFYNAAFVDSMHERRSGSIATLRDHTHFFVSMVSQVVSGLEQEPAKILDHLDHIGQSHAYLKRYGFKSSHWEKVGEYFVDHVVIQDCVRGFPEACRAWTVLVSSIVDRVRAAPRRSSFLPSPGSPRRGSIFTSSQLSINNDESPRCPMFSRSAHSSTSRLCSSEKLDRRGSIVLPATTIDMSTLKDALPTPPPNNFLPTNNNTDVLA